MAADRREEIAALEMDALRQGEPGGVFGSEREGLRRDVDGVNRRFGPLGRQRQGDNPGARADIEDAAWYCGEGQQELDQVLGLRAGDQRSAVTQEDAAVKIDRAQQMLERLAGAAPYHQSAERVQFAISQRPVEFEVKIDPFLAEHVSEQVLGVEPRAFDPMFLEVSGGGGEDLLERLQGRIMKYEV